MAEFARLPTTVRRAVAEHTSSDEDVLFCFVAGSPVFSSGDYVIITTDRVLILDERRIGYLNAPYVNVQCDLPFGNILSVECERFLKHWLFHQMIIKLRAPDRTHLIGNVSYGDGKKAMALLTRLCEEWHDGVP